MVVAAHAGEPGPLPGQRPIQRCHLAGGAAGLGAALPEVGGVLVGPFDPEAEFDGVTATSIISQLLLEIAPPSDRLAV